MVGEFSIRSEKKLIGVVAIYRGVWLCRNDMVFKKNRSNSYLRVIFREHTGSNTGLSYLEGKI